MIIELYHSNIISWIEKSYFKFEKLVILLKNEDFDSFLRFINYIIKY